MNPKRLLIILGVLIALFFVGTGWGVFSDDQSVGGTAEAVVNMVRGLQVKEPLSPDDVISATPANCRELLSDEQFIIAAGGSCQIDVGESSAPVRALTLRLQQGGPVSLRMISGNENGLDHTERLPLDNDGDTDDPNRIELQFTREGGRLIISCRSPQTRCELDVATP